MDKYGLVDGVNYFNSNGQFRPFVMTAWDSRDLRGAVHPTCNCGKCVARRRHEQ